MMPQIFIHFIQLEGQAYVELIHYIRLLLIQMENYINVGMISELRKNQQVIY